MKMFDFVERVLDFCQRHYFQRDLCDMFAKRIGKFKFTNVLGEKICKKNNRKWKNTVVVL